MPPSTAPLEGYKLQGLGLQTVCRSESTLPWQEFRAAIKGHEMNVHLFGGQSIHEGERKPASMLNAVLTNFDCCRADH